MTPIEPFNEQEICQILAWIDPTIQATARGNGDREAARLAPGIIRRAILWGIHAQAMREKLKFFVDCFSSEDPHWNWTDADWIDMVKKRVGFKDEV